MYAAATSSDGLREPDYLRFRLPGFTNGQSNGLRFRLLGLKLNILRLDYKAIIDKYYPEDNDLKRLLLRHSRDVADKALAIADRHPELHLDRRFLEEGAMIHDIGVFMCDAQGIHCHGTEPYIRHGIIGGLLLRAEGFSAHARVCERHTGTGLTRKNIYELSLPLPDEDFLPETMEEQVICYADKFFSKAHPDRRRDVEQTARSLQKFGNDGVVKFRHWAEMFE